MHKIVLLGAGGHCNSCIDVIENEKKFKIAGVIDNKKNDIKKFNYNYLGNDKNLEDVRKKYKYALITIGQIKYPLTRFRLFEKIKKLKFKLPVVKSKLSYVSKYSFIEEGTIVMHYALVNSNAKIGKYCIINNTALVEHDSIIGDHCHVSTGAIINGNVNIGNGTFIGSGSIIKEGIKIGNNCLIGAGITLKKDVKNNQIIK